MSHRRCLIEASAFRPPFTGVGRYARALMADAQADWPTDVPRFWVYGQPDTPQLQSGEFALPLVNGSRNAIRAMLMMGVSLRAGMVLSPSDTFLGMNFATLAPRSGRAVTLVYDTTFLKFPPSRRLGLVFARLTARTWARADAILTISQAARAALVDAYGERPGVSVLPVPHGLVPAPATSPLSAPSFALTIGSCSPRKRCDVSREATARARTNLVRVGAGHSPRCGGQLLGPLSDSDLGAVLVRAGCLIAASACEGLDLPVLEAQAVGVPVVASRTPEHAETLGEGAMLFDEGDAAGAARLVGEAVQQFEHRDPRPVGASPRVAGAVLLKALFP